MKIVTYKISLAVADHIEYADVLDMLKTIADKPIGIYGIEIECAKPGEERAPTGAEEAPRKKRKYTRRAKPAEGDDKRAAARGRVQPAGAVVKDGVVRVKRDDGTMVERRGNCQGGNAS